MQSNPIPRDLYFCPQKQIPTPPSVIWKLKKLPYRIVYFERKWLMTSDDWINSTARLTSSTRYHHLFYQQYYNGQMSFMVSNANYDFRITVKRPSIDYFLAKLEKRFDVVNLVVSSERRFNGLNAFRPHEFVFDDAQIPTASPSSRHFPPETQATETFCHFLQYVTISPPGRRFSLPWKLFSVTYLPCGIRYVTETWTPARQPSYGRKLHAH